MDTEAQHTDGWAKDFPNSISGDQAVTMPGHTREHAAYTFVLLIMLLVTGTPAAPAQTNIQPLVSGNTEFACDLYARLKAQPGNLFVSPYSISTCLAMVDAGARGQTAAQMARVLHFPNDQSQLSSSFGELQRNLNNSRQPGGVELEIANALWSQQGHPFLPQFLDSARQNYDANLNQADFKTAAEPAREQINSWVLDHTGGHIPDLLAPGVLNAATRLVLVNAIYFKGKWQVPFDPTNTIIGPFAGPPGTGTATYFMRATNRFNYTETEDVQLLEMRYAGNQLAMVVVLPKETLGLANVENKLTATNLAAWLGMVEQPRAGFGKVNVYLPKFKITSQFALGRTLEDMGMTDAFAPSADFSGMDGSRDLLLSAVIHKAFVEVGEEGTVAAAATGAMVSALAIMQPPPTPLFRADHPFLFFIRDVNSGSILFLGRVNEPARAPE